MANQQCWMCCEVFDNTNLLTQIDTNKTISVICPYCRVSNILLPQPHLCFYCYKDLCVAEDFEGDTICPHCSVENSIFKTIEKHNDNPADCKEQDTCEEWLNEKGEEEMADLSDLKNYLKNSIDLQAGDIITFIDAGEIKDVDFSKTQDGSQVKTVFQIMIELPNGKNKIYTPNATTREILSKQWSANTETWINKKAKVNFVKQLAFGKVIDVLVLEPIEEIANA